MAGESTPSSCQTTIEITATCFQMSLSEIWVIDFLLADGFCGEQVIMQRDEIGIGHGCYVVADKVIGIDGGATASYYYGPLQPEEQE